MKKYIWISLLLFVFAINFYGQESSRKLKFHAIDFSPLNVYGGNKANGIILSAGISIKMEKHILKLFVLTGSELNISVLGPSTSERFSELSLLYGRETDIKKWLYIDGYAGIGYFSYTLKTPEAIPGTGGSGWFDSPDYKDEEDRTSTIGFPLQGRIGFQPGRRFSLGLQFHTNLNAVNTYYSLGLFLQWKLGKVK